MVACRAWSLWQGLVVDVESKAALRALASISTRLAELSRGRDENVLATRPSAGEWSATEIIAHLRGNADVWGSSIQRMIDDDHPTLRYVSPRGAMKKPEYADRGFTESLDLFLAARRALLKRLKALPLEGWSRGATFTGRTRGRESTVLDYARAIAAHEAAHIVQFEALFTRASAKAGRQEPSAAR